MREARGRPRGGDRDHGLRRRIQKNSSSTSHCTLFASSSFSSLLLSSFPVSWSLSSLNQLLRKFSSCMALYSDQVFFSFRQRPVFQHSLSDCVPQLCLRLESSILNLCFKPLAFFPGDSSSPPSTFHSSRLSGTVPCSSVGSFSTFSQALSCLPFLVYIGSLTLAPPDTARNPNTFLHHTSASPLVSTLLTMSWLLRCALPHFLCAQPHTFTCPWHFHFYFFSARHSSIFLPVVTLHSAQRFLASTFLLTKNPLVFRASAGVLRSRE